MFLAKKDIVPTCRQKNVQTSVSMPFTIHIIKTVVDDYDFDFK